jgi:tetratricopeptide (TPR) repeat protein
MTMPGKRMGFQELTALVQRGDVRQEKGDSLGALGDYERALREAPDDPMIWNNRGVSLSSLGRYDEAIGSYRKAIDIRPGYWIAWYNLGKAIHRRADKMLRPARLAGGAETEALSDGTMAAQADAYEEAISAYDRALELNPTHASTLNNKAVALRKLGRYEEALGVYDEQLGNDPLYAHAWHNKGLLLKLMGLPEQADKCFEVAAGLDPEFAAPAGRRAGPVKRLSRKRPTPFKAAGGARGEGAEETDLRDVERPKPVKPKAQK